MRRSINDTQIVAMNRIEGAPLARTGVPVGAYLLALVMGTLAFFATVSVILLVFIATPPFPLPLWVDSFFLLPFAVSYLILAALFSFLWPDVSWKWGLWLSLPCVFAVILIHLANTPGGTGLLSPIMASLLVVLFPACACGLLGKRFAPCEQLISAAKEGFSETILGEQVSASMSRYADIERFNEVDKSVADDSRQKGDESLSKAAGTL